jgi:hypothetical protein
MSRENVDLRKAAISGSNGPTWSRRKKILKEEGIKLVSSLDNFILKDGGLVIEILGPPKSGKTWQIVRLIEFLENDPEFRKLKPDFDYRVFKISMKDERNKDDRYDFHMCYAQAHAYNLRRVRQRRKHPDVELVDLDLVIADRGPLDDNIWPHVWYEEGKMTLEERDTALRTSQEAESLVNAKWWGIHVEVKL